MIFCIDDKDFWREFPFICNPLRSLNMMLRSYCITGTTDALDWDDGDFPRFTEAEFDGQAAEELMRRLEDAPIGKRPKTAPRIALSLTVDYGNGYVEKRPYTLFKDSAMPLFREIHEKSLFMFRSLYGMRRGGRK